jgi:hypothetical protein
VFISVGAEPAFDPFVCTVLHVLLCDGRIQIYSSVAPVKCMLVIVSAKELVKTSKLFEKILYLLVVDVAPK